ncbi:MAG TPA: hypothetical protein VHA06_05675, partial [Candidatus Angelobacter sp.]|nr:hypothetical protein [Candidatus Angelobacter sp.]
MQTKTKVPFDCLMTALSKLFFLPLLLLVWPIANRQLLIAKLSKTLRTVAQPHSSAFRLSNHA